MGREKGMMIAWHLGFSGECGLESVQIQIKALTAVIFDKQIVGRADEVDSRKI